MIGRGLLRRRARPDHSLPECHEPDHLRVAARSHVGKVREINEDRFLVRSERGLWAVADGMGGHSAGGDAASVAIDGLAELADGGGLISGPAIHAVLRAANRRIRTRLKGRDAMSGTTIVVAWLDGDTLNVFWAGDSRAYRLRDGQVSCLTRDHSVVQELLDAGEISLAEAERHPAGHLVTRALGAADMVALDQISVDLRPGDHLVLCSDGVSRSLDPHGFWQAEHTVDQFADGLLGMALQRDGSDNATLIAVQVSTRFPAQGISP